MKAVIIEDEKHAREILLKMIRLIRPGIEVVGQFATKKEAVTFLNNRSVDLVFLDINLKDANGFDVLRETKHLDFAVIFTTAYDHYAVKAFKVNALDYLLKPINPEELEIAIEKAEKLSKQKTFLTKQLENAAQKPTKIVLKTTEQTYFVPFEDIIRLEAEGSYTTFYTKDQKIMVSKNLKYYEEILPDNMLVRSHQSHLVVVSQIKSLKNDELLLKNGDTIPVSTRKRKQIKTLLEK